MQDKLPSEMLSEFLKWLSECETQLHIFDADEKLMEEETQDILHRLELVNDCYLDRKKLCDALPSIRQKRRFSKDGSELLSPIVDWVEDNKKCISSLQQLLGAVRKIERSKQDRCYYERTEIVKELLGKEKAKRVIR